MEIMFLHKISTVTTNYTLKKIIICPLYLLKIKNILNKLLSHKGAVDYEESVRRLFSEIPTLVRAVGLPNP